MVGIIQTLLKQCGGWIEVFFPEKETNRLRYYSQFFETAEWL
jgi:hypothetical protein